MSQRETSAMSHRPQPPAGELFADAGAKAVWAAIEMLEPGQQHEIYRLLAGGLAVPENERSPLAQRQARVVAALRQAADLLEGEGKGRLVGVDAYRRLREEHRGLGWPPDGSLRRWVGGSWNDALRLAALDPVPDGDALVREHGGGFTRGECLAAVKEYVKESGDQLPAMWRYMTWAGRRDVRARPGRRPLSQHPFDRNFEGWGDVLVQAGLVAGNSTTGVPRGMSAAASTAEPPHGARDNGDGERPRVRVFSRSGYGYKPEQIRAGLREIAERLADGERLTTTVYARERQRLIEDEDARGLPPRAFPSVSLIQKRFEHWDDALVDAGLPPANGRHIKAGYRTGPRPKRVTNEEILAAIREAHEAVADDGQLTTVAYGAWRKEQMARDRAEGCHRRIPALNVVWERYGKFEDACRLALAEPAGDDAGASGGEPGRCTP